MYNIDLNEDEMIIYNNDDVKAISDTKVLEVSLVITNQRFIILEDFNAKSNMNALLKTVKAVGLMPRREVLFSITLDRIISLIPGEYVKVVLDNNTFIEVSDSNIIHILENR